MTAMYTRSTGQRVPVASVNVHQLRNATRNLHKANPRHPDLGGMIAEIDRHDAEYFGANPDAARPEPYPWKAKA